MDQSREHTNGAPKGRHGLWIALAATAAGLAAAGVVIARKRATSPTNEVSRILNRCEAAATQLGRRLAA